jgi:hypothetical protein
MAEGDGARRLNSTRIDTRRRFLAVLAAGGASGLAGCSSGGNGDDGADATSTETDAAGAGDSNEDGGASGEPNPTETTADSGTSTSTSGEDSGDGGGGGDDDGGVSESAADPYGSSCPMPPFSYSQQTYEAPNDPVASFTMDAPEFPEIVKAGGITFRFGNAESTTTVSASFSDLGESVSDILASSSDAYEETIDAYDLRPSDARSFTQELTGTWQTQVMYPVEEGVASLLVTLRTGGGEFGCSEAGKAIRTRVVESIGPA